MASDGGTGGVLNAEISASNSGTNDVTGAFDAEISALYIYPLKAARGVRLSSAPLSAWGLAHDRCWLVVTPRSDGELGFVSQRQNPLLATVIAEVELLGDGSGAPAALALSCGVGAAAPPLRVPLVRAGDGGGGAVRPAVRIWRDVVSAVDQGDAAAAWLRAVLGGDDELRLVYADAAVCARQCDAAFAAPGEQTAFSDGFPVLLASEASLDALNAGIAAGPLASQGPLPMARFRPNVVVRAVPGGPPLPPWDEDTWREFQVELGGGGGAVVAARGVKRCSRCLVTTTDQATGAQGTRASEPLRTLGELRADSARKGVYFGQNVCLAPAGELRVGARVRVLARGPVPPL